MRKLLKPLCLTLVLILALALCGCQSAPSGTSAAPTPTPGAASRDETVDFVVVGAGAAGVSAATEAARQGKSVVLLEKLGFAGGSSALNEGYLWACGSQLNEQTGKGYTPAQMKAYLRASSRGNANHALNDNLVDVSSDIMDFIVDEGAVFLTDRFTGSGGDAQDLDVFIAEGEGNGLFTSLLRIAEKHGVTPRYESPATALIVEDGTVKGVTVTDKDGTYNIYAGATVLCTGGFLKSEELMKEYMPEWYSENAYCTAGATGDGHKWALALGAQMNGYGCGGVWRTEDGKNGYKVEGGLAPCVSFFITNIEGKRFCNEYMGSDKNQLINEQSNKMAYCFMDSTSPYAALAEQGVANGYTYKADTLEELCAVYGIDEANLLKTVAEYNECKASGGQDPFYVPTDYMVSMSQPPYYMSLFDPSMNTNCLMGLATDAFCRILDGNGAPIEGLYGAGELIVGNLCGGTKAGPRYPSCGTCLAAGMYGGPLAVRHALGQYAQAEADAALQAVIDKNTPATKTMSYSAGLKEMAHEILMAAGRPYSDKQLSEIPRILNTKSRYFIANDLNDYEVLRDVFTEEGYEGFHAVWSGYPGASNIEDQISSVQFTIGQGDVAPTHYGANQIVRFLDDTHAQLLTRMHDHHTYTDGTGEVYEGYGLYVDDMLKCDDGVWRIETLRLDYGVIVGELRANAGG